MKQIEMNVEIGEGLFSDEPIEHTVNFINGSGVFLLTPMTGEVMIELEEAGVVLTGAGFASNTEAVRASRAVLSKVLHGWRDFVVDGVEVPYSEKARDQIASTLVGGRLMSASVELAIRVREAEEGN